MYQKLKTQVRNKRYEKKLFHEKNEVYKPRRKKEKTAVIPTSGVSIRDGFFHIDTKKYEEYKQFEVLSVEIMERAIRDVMIFGIYEIPGIFVANPEKSDIIAEVEEKPVFNSTAESWGFDDDLC